MARLQAWLVDNPGRQEIGSFHPITLDNWTEGAYLHELTPALFTAVNGDQAEEVEKLLAEEGAGEGEASIVHARDGLGRTLLIVAALSNASKACQTLLGIASSYSNTPLSALSF